MHVVVVFVDFICGKKWSWLKNRCSAALTTFDSDDRGEEVTICCTRSWGNARSISGSLIPLLLRLACARDDKVALDRGFAGSETHRSCTLIYDDASLPDHPILEKKLKGLRVTAFYKVSVMFEDQFNLSV